jgi:glycosyltransferase involved in cell wall biosynthesis
MDYGLNNESNQDVPVNARIYIINRYPPLSSPYRWANDLLSVFGEKATSINLNFNPRKIKFNDNGINFTGRFTLFPSLNHFLRNAAFVNYRRYIETENQYKRKVILHYTNQFSGSFRIPRVTEIVNVQDSPFYMENLSILEKIYMRSLYNSLKDLPYIVTNTKYLKNELISFGFTGKITTVYLPYSPIFRKLPANKEEIRMALGLPLDKKLILSVSTDSPRKNLPMVKRVIDELGSDFMLVRVGTPLGKSITFKDIDDKTLNKLYNASDVLLFPSFYEGFGLPIIEAFATGLPVVASEIPTIIEIAGKSAVLSDPNDVNDLKRAVNFALDNSEKLSREGNENAKKFSISNFKDAILKLYRDVEESSS